jgi:3-oxoacyl-[acyl-carrier-protein] synthase II
VRVYGQAFKDLTVSGDVVVTGLGTINPLGSSVDASWSAALEGISGIVPVTENWNPDLPVKIAGLVNPNLGDFFTHAQMRRLDRAQQLALISFKEAWQDSGISNYDPERLAVSLGTGLAGALTFQSATDIVAEKGINRIPPFFIPMTMPNASTAAIALATGALGATQTLTSACASGADAIANAFRLIKLGEADIVICGGTEASVFPLTAAGFAAMRALSLNPDPSSASRPFDINRDGFVLAEGAGILIVESEEHAKARNARIQGRILGVSTTSEGHHIVQPDPAGSGPAKSMQLALDRSGVSLTDICHINAHATSTPLGDLAESIAIERVFKSHTPSILVSATKSMTGHLIAAAGAVESIFTIKALNDNMAPPSINITEIDPAVNVNITLNEAVSIPPKKAALQNSFGFGGHNVSLVFTS